MSFLLLFGCEKEASIQERDSIDVKKDNSFAVPASKIGEFVASHFEVTAYISANQKSKDNLKNARTSEVPSISLFSEENEIEKIESLKEDDGSELIHIINFRSKNKQQTKNGFVAKKGFVIMSADKRAIPVLAWSDEREFVLEGISGHPIEMWLGYAKEVVRRAKKQKEPGKEALVSWKKLDEYIAKKNGRTTNCPHPNPQICSPCNPDWNILVGPVTEPNSMWEQGTGYNNNMWSRGCGDCGKAATGCAAVAMGMIMRFDRRPSTGYNFDIMPQTVDAQCTGLDAGETEVARLLYDLSATMNSSNAPAGCATFTLPGQVDNGFSWAGYSQTGTSTSSVGLMEGETQFGRPVMMSGTTAGMSLNDAHYWVCDGYNSTSYGYSYSGLPEDCFYIINTYHHINWGWGGRDNGWFTIGNLNPGGTGNYDSWLRVRIGVRP